MRDLKKIFWILFVIVVLILISVGYHKSLNSNDVGSGDNINEPLNDQIQGLPTSGEKEVLVENDTKELDDDVKNADKIEEMKTICWFCPHKATMNLRIHNGKPVYEGEQVQIGGNESYYPVCRKHYFHPQLKQ